MIIQAFYVRNITAQCSELQQGAERRGWIRFIQGSRDAADLKGKDDAIKEAFEKFQVRTWFVPFVLLMWNCPLQRALLESVKEDTSNIKKNVCNVITGQEDVAKVSQSLGGSVFLYLQYLVVRSDVSTSLNATAPSRPPSLLESRTSAWLAPSALLVHESTY